jgi:imidazolonepropionase
MQLVLTLACVNLRLSVEEALRAATKGGARARRIEHEAGSQEAGKRADLVVLDALDYRELPYHFGVNLARWVVAAGEIVVSPHD